jgi:hypothetical protein
VGRGGPRARQELTRGGVKPSSEVGVSWCGACPSSKAEVRSWGAGAGCLLDRRGFLGHGPFFALGRGRAGCDLRLVCLIVHF